MAKEGLVKHVHFNNTQGKDDDHNLINIGLLDIHTLRKKLRGAGIKEAFIFEGGGRGGGKNRELLTAFETFGVGLDYKQEVNLNKGKIGSSGVSNWIDVKRDYDTKLEYSQYGFSENTFRDQPQQGQEMGGWSKTKFF